MKFTNTKVQMMQNVHLAPETDEDDLYSGYNDYNPIYDIEELENDAAFQQAVRTSHGRRPPSKTSLASSIGRPMTGAIQDGVTRPMTAVRAAGFTKAALRGSAFDPLSQSRGPASPLEAKKKDSPEEKIKQLEKEVNELVEESCIANSCGDLKLALEKAKDAGRKERVLVRQREQVTTPENINLDLTYSVLFNLASQYSVNEMYAEALNTYQVIVKNKMFSNAGILKMNMGNIYLKQRNYSKAIKFYRMALDQVPSVNKQMRIKIMQNIGVTFIQADREKMKKAFQKLITVPLEIDEDKYISPSDDPHTNLVTEAIKNDHLRQMERERKAMAEKYIMTSAKLIAPVIETSFAAGYDWCVEVVKASQYVELANDLEINKAVTYLRQKDYNQAVEILKVLEKKDSRVKSAAATNLSALYYMGKDFAQASSYADIAVNSDRYNPAALTNKGNTVFANGDYEKAAEFYKEALRNDSSCTEALYNIGLTYEKLNRLDEALDCFLKLHAILRNSAEVLYQIANIYELMENPSQAIEWLMQVVSVIPTDPQVLSKLGELYDREGDKSQAFQYYYESYRYFPCNIEVIEWLGAYYIDTQFWEKAIQYFERASLIQPTQVKWQLMVASCFRRSGNYQKALDTYKDTHRKFPENVECLRFLVRLCTDLGLKDAQEYARKLKRLEKMKEIREQRIKSGRDGSGGSRGKREGSASGDSGQNYSASSKGERLSARLRALPGTNEPYESSSNKEIDASYVDPLGPQIERPKTAAKKRIDEDDFADEELGDDLLPE
ncbi:intraflagellar transport protein 88 homolog isoform X12 [Homo sapiens]|uniref:intraflagellar transport protein 88 homolog isoform X12 n=2 Tax=Homo sapiens TaxID=9606 RepID=UPI000D0C95C1|nr:intraflagellar transport protein 88 homolog isoform X12 [Homo sapiens]XP_047286624.1 intraflagellar transport protein 88 homolog isoform X12 [Homo sapiens]|eukprot:XP_024305181.1 intraflagellar transport protein 88 homolog isoform X8 [Homo sapiens]